MPRIIVILILSVLFVIPIYFLVTFIVKRISRWLDDICQWDITVEDIKEKKKKLSETLDDNYNELSDKIKQHQKHKEEFENL